MNSKPIHLAIAFFQWKEWPIQKTNDPNTIVSIFQGKNGQWNVYALQHPERVQLAFYSLFPIHFQDRHIPKLLEFVARANEGLIIGNFEIFLEHKEIRFKTSIDLTDQELNMKYCNPLVYYNLLSMDNHYLALSAMIEQDFSCKYAMGLISTDTP